MRARLSPVLLSTIVLIGAAVSVSFSGTALAQPGSAGGWLGNDDKSISGHREKPAKLVQPPRRGVEPQASTASCRLASVWSNQVSDGGPSVWTITADGTATEQGRGNARGHAVLSGRTLTITWSIGIANGNYVVNLNEACTAGAGTTTVLGGFRAGDVQHVTFTAAR